MGNMSGSYGDHYTLQAVITQNSQNIANNTSNVTVKLQLVYDGSGYYAYTYDTTYGSLTINGTKYDGSISEIVYSGSTAKTITLMEKTLNIAHNADGTKTLAVSGTWDTGTSRIGSGSCSASKTLTPIPRYATCTQSLNTKTINTIKMNWSSDSTIDYVWYSINNGSSWTAVGSVNASSGSYTITGLSGNTAYNIKTRVRRKDSQLTTDSTALAVTTYNKATISSAPNFNHGATETITYSNPSGQTMAIGIYGTDAATAYAAYRTCTGTSYKFTLTDAELDKIYKAYGNASTITLRVYLRTTCNGTNYYDYKAITVTLKGNQKTIHTKVSGNWRRGKTWLKVSGNWKQAVVWEKVSGTWRRAI